MKPLEQSIEDSIKGEIYSVERLEEYAAYLARELKISDSPEVVQTLLPRMRENGRTLVASYRTLTESLLKKDIIPTAAEWLTDNFHIVEDQLREIQEDLPPSYYKELPKIAIGELTGYPRIYAIALAIIAHTDSELDPDTIRKFAHAFQRIAPLTIGELWALPITLRLVLVENLRRLAVRVVYNHDTRNKANKLADDLFAAVPDKVAFQKLVTELARSLENPVRDDFVYIAQLAKRLRDQEPEVWPAFEVLETYLTDKSSSTESVVHLSLQRQTSNQVTVANIITSMRLISSLNWRDFFESLSLVDRILERDSVYARMDFQTRDRYRHVIENLGKQTGFIETEIADEVVKLARQALEKNPLDSKRAHVGYYLIDHGFKRLSDDLNYKPRRIIDFMHSHQNFTYFGLICFLLLTILTFPLVYAYTWNASPLLLFGIFVLLIFPCSELALSLTNLLITHLIPPRHLPKLDLSKGIPKEARTMIIIPCLLSSASTIKDLLGKLEIHFLGNSDEQLYFSLLTDFMDAQTEKTDTDEELLKIAMTGIAWLNQKYAGKDSKTFFLFNRRRQWNESENAWMGWERKRGKIEEFNHLLRGKRDTSFDLRSSSNAELTKLLASIKYVITLDADTQLPRDAARKLIGTGLHPLNQPVFDANVGRVVEGYGILQPRIGVSLESSTRSIFAKTFSGYIGIDPYTTAVSEVYQDLFHEGTYTGKGLYDVDAFENALKGRAPENKILSHDLFEGTFARAALVTDVELLDDYPQSYRTFFTRQHRWIRGDWQIGSWIFAYVKNASGQKVKNDLSLISRWKIFDNLRRSLIAPITLLWLTMAWTVLPGEPLLWFGLFVSLLVVPLLVQSTVKLFILLFGKRTSRTSGVWTGVKSNTKTNTLQILFHIIFLAHQAYIQTDAIIRVLYRQLVSKKKLLEWSTAAQVENQASDSLPFWQTSWPLQLMLVAVSILILLRQPNDFVAWPMLITLWMSYPIVATFISRRQSKTMRPLDLPDRLLLRQIARRTWNYFETFAGASDNYLPPDNHQILPEPVTAHRTSPTNIGLYLLSIMSARDFGYLSTSRFVLQTKRTLATMAKLERHEGHYLNWYDTKTLSPLHPKYVSTVDSGNLAAYLVAVRQACLEVPKSSVFDAAILRGIEDTILIVEHDLVEKGDLTNHRQKYFRDLRKSLTPPLMNDFNHWYVLLNSVQKSFESAKAKNISSDGIVKWIDLSLNQIQDVLVEMTDLAPWLQSSYQHIESRLPDVLAKKWSRAIGLFSSKGSFSRLLQTYDTAIIEVDEIIKSIGDMSPLNKPLLKFCQSLNDAKSKVQGILDDARSAAEFLDLKFNEMNFDFLLAKDREVFSIGYNVNENRFDRSLYDLLGSEARVASFVAIAKGDVEQEHWFKLGRQLVPVAGGRALVSWTASMFEYLMPMLIIRDYENTLLSETMQSVVSAQIKYGQENRVPWGVSEAGYNARDLHMNYQYGPFGVPGLGLKRGLSHDLVISPYSTLLAAMVNPAAALENIKMLIKNRLLSTHGFYEAVDYTRDRLPSNEKFAVIKSFMAHHQGMSLVSLNNILHDFVVQDRFHSDPRIRATRLLLQERIPQNVIPIPPKAAEIEIEAQRQPLNRALVRHYTDPTDITPRIHLLSNRKYSIMISTAGGGYSKCGDLGVTRWREDSTCDNTGSFIFIKNLNENKTWSATFQPFAVLPEDYQVTFSEDKVEFRRRDGEVSTCMQILVAPEDDVEIRHIILTNHSSEPQSIELTSYLEPTLFPPNSDLDHPSFSKLFIQTEYLASKNALLAKRRKRSGHDNENWGLHVVVTDAEIIADVQYETDRSKFIGRGRTLKNSIALTSEQNLTNTIGATIDPILSLRMVVQVPANGQAQVAFTTGLATSREKALELADRYHDIHSFDRESKRAWTQAQVDLRHLDVDSQTAYMYQRLAERILYSEPSLRPPTHVRVANTNQQSSLWPSGIGGDLPIVVVRLNDQKDLPTIRRLLRCHEYLRLKGLVYDFVIINEQDSTYHQDMQEDVLHQIRSTGNQAWLNKNGGIFVLRKNVTPSKDLAHIQSVARVTLLASEPLNEQIHRRAIDEKYPSLATYSVDEIKYENTVTPNLNLDFFNGSGGFSKDGKEYVIILKKDHWTPAPWINVIGNANNFGFQISESGSGFTWSTNSQANRLTPWSNDPICDPPGEIIYLRDEETGKIWTPTPLPIRSEQPYVVRHGQGYSIFEHTDHGIEHTLKVFVPRDDTLKISLLTLKNKTKLKRTLSITSYIEWVLGTRREKTAANLICDIDAESGAVFAKNPHDNEFAHKIAFADISATDRTFTCSRKEFLGRNGDYINPAALSRRGLSQKRGTGQDPCSVLQTRIEILPGEEFQLAILLGQSETTDQARSLIKKYKNVAQGQLALQDVIKYWNDLINVVQIKTPEPSMNILMNHWLLYQTLSCRYWSRTAFYQSGGAFGFRDQLQDCMAFVYSNPKLAREHIIRASERQFPEGDVQHWWHPPTGRGIRTTMSDDLLWLPYVVSFYIKTTGDKSILDERTTFIDAPVLKPGQDDSYTQPSISSQTATVFEHCLKAIQRSLSVGQHGLPLIGSGDWNDGMNRVGTLGTGESVWLAWFLYKVLDDFTPFCNEETSTLFRSHMFKLKVAIEKDGWDGEWYRRAYYDDGTPIGSAINDECKIDSISQSWSVLSNAGDRLRSELAMEKIDEYLVKKDSKLILLLTPPFDKTPKDPGYIKGYIPGVRENGGQYTHAAIWAIMANAQLGLGTKAHDLFNLINPILHADSAKGANKYKIEPYVLAGDVYGHGDSEGRGGWSWYTGSSSWYYRAGLESLLGFQLKANKLKIAPCIPTTWPEYELKYRYGQSLYTIQVKNPHALSSGPVKVEIDGQLTEGQEINLVDDQKNHSVFVTILIEENKSQVTALTIV